jgi:hypothetical protein
MWNVNPNKMCDKHLRGEHFEMHMFAGSIRAGISIKGYVDKGLVEVHNIEKRHEELEKYCGWNSSLPDFNYKVDGSVNVIENEKELARRCLECRKIQGLCI